MTGAPVIARQGSVRAMGAIGQAAQRPLGSGILTGAPVAVASTGVSTAQEPTRRRPREGVGSVTLPFTPARTGGLL